MKDALLVVDPSLTPCDGSLLICESDGAFKVKRYRTQPRPHLENVSTAKMETLPERDDGEASPIFGVITYIINDVR